MILLRCYSPLSLIYVGPELQIDYMTTPIEITNKCINNRLSICNKAIQSLQDPQLIPKYATRLSDITKRYKRGTIVLLGEYYSCKDETERHKKTQQFNYTVSSLNITYLMTDFMSDIVKCIKDQNVARDLTNIFETSQNISAMQPVDYKICPVCREGKTLTIIPHLAELSCIKCAYTIELKGTMLEDSQISGYQNTQIAKRGRYETSKHCKYHLERILAIKNPNIPDRVWNKIDDWIKDQRILYPKYITCAQYRRCLKDVKETRYNEYIPYIRQCKSGISPQRLYYHEVQQVYMYFDKAVQAYNNITGGEGNLRFYPYFISQILKFVLNKKEDQSRLQSILECIHFQRDETIINNDKIWEKICSIVPEFYYQKTDKTLIFR